MIINNIKNFPKKFNTLNFNSSFKTQQYFKKNLEVSALKKQNLILNDFDYISQKWKIDNKELIRVYGTSSDNWGDLSYFKGDYINFGYWKNIKLDSDEISVEDRIKSSKDLYWEILKDLDIKNNHTVLEAGCGRGMGIIDLLSQMSPKKIIALDMNAEQLKKIEDKLIQRKIALNIDFLNKDVYNTELPDNCIDRIYSIEVAQHFDDMFSFAQEMKRILKKDGKLIFTTYFLQHPIQYQKLVKSLPHIDYKLDKLHLVKNVHEDFYKAGFKNVSCKSIGSHVFYGYDRWLKQMNSNVWSQQFYQAYKQDIIDYCIMYVE